VDVTGGCKDVKKRVCKAEREERGGIISRKGMRKGGKGGTGRQDRVGT